MEKFEKVAAYYEKEHPFKEAIGMLKQVVKRDQIS